MKKLLAILLTLAMMLPLYGLAEETAPQATLTTITFRDFNGRALMAEMEEAAETAYRDLLDALRVEVYRQGFTSCELFLNDQSIVDYGVQTRGADVYISGDVLDGISRKSCISGMRPRAYMRMPGRSCLPRRSANPLRKSMRTWAHCWRKSRKIR